jgi:2-iminobutanoate/2-iminopropanoate deaminase
MPPAALATRRMAGNDPSLPQRGRNRALSWGEVRVKILVAVSLALCAVPAIASAAPFKYIPAGTNGAGGAHPAYSAALQDGDTLYVSGTADGIDPDTGKKPVDAKTGAKVVLNSVKGILEKAGYTMDDLVWVQIFATDLKDYGDFNDAYRTYFKGPLPARAFIGAGSLLGGAHFEVMGIARKH